MERPVQAVTRGENVNPARFDAAVAHPVGAVMRRTDADLALWPDFHPRERDGVTASPLWRRSQRGDESCARSGGTVHTTGSAVRNRFQCTAQCAMTHTVRLATTIDRHRR